MARFTPITEARFDEGARRGGKPGPHARSASFEEASHRIVIRLDTGLDLSFDPKDASGLQDASVADLSEIEIVGAGGAIHFPRLDTFFSIPGLLEGFLGPLQWTQRQKRAAASRENGRLGGRPRKSAAA